MHLCYVVKVEVNNTLSKWIGQELSKSDRPELTSAGTVISGGKYVVLLQEEECCHTVSNCGDVHTQDVE